MNKKTAFILALLIFPISAFEPLNSPPQWHEDFTFHYHIFHQDFWLPMGFTLKLENIHNRMRRDLAWCWPPVSSGTRIPLYLYRNQKLYARGRFHPPTWSVGLAEPSIHTILTFNQKPLANLFQIIAHETTHVIFVAYWMRAGKYPPYWLNEGLAMVEQTSEEHAKDCYWYRQIYYLSAHNLIPLKTLLQLEPMKMDNTRAIEIWYVESYSLIYFLLRKHPIFYFNTFVSNLREGRSLKYALWAGYRYTPKSLERAWLQFLDIKRSEPHLGPISTVGLFHD
jgi:hypothetical protein